MSGEKGKLMSKKFIFFNTARGGGRVGIDPKFVAAVGVVKDGTEIIFLSGKAIVVQGSAKSVADTLEGIYDHEWDYSDLWAEREKQ